MNAGNHIPDGDSYTAQIARLEAAEARERRLCEIGKHWVREADTETIELTGERICWACRESWTLQGIWAYVKGSEPELNPRDLFSVIDQLYPQHEPPRVNKILLK
jgi:hypothetical protein